MDTRYAYEITAKRPGGRKQRRFVQYHTGLEQAKQTAAGMLGLQGLELLGVELMSSDACRRRGIPHSVKP